ncbi:PREDICTED: SAWADEE HOMEODOMAIN [Prunus dulcis]|uniref:PREDICTED: SAWADEE HOMEODOMAIN n=1 Tax=Prunus dulcis TaxID=3755 RepID=A0A5E4FYL8_PRUDU|nr:PREDICTED: SAWADEE HOMEODOMAIN [Prunus dulcis]
MVKISISTLFNDDLHLRRSTLSSTSAAWSDRNPSLLPFESHSAGRAGKPIVKWTEVQSWLQNRAQELPNISKISLSNREFTLRMRHSEVLKYLEFSTWSTWCCLVSYGYCPFRCLNKLFYKPLCLKLHL